VCNNLCVYCHHLHLEEDEKWQLCNKCNRYLKNDTCFQMHMKKSDAGKSTCNTYYKCKTCDQTINMNRHKKAHVCHEQYCKTCNKISTRKTMYVLYNPLATTIFLQRIHQNKRDISNTYFFIFFCTQDDILECEQGYNSSESGRCTHCLKFWCGSYQHRPNLCVVHKVCD